ncbi:MAG: DUF3795 domain-containing protein [Clostridia bacterium]|nr:DUF3795 domain-containing protein [Clostridia bacterium]
MLYLITGPAGTGKSTISKVIAKSLEKSVLLEGDDFYHQVKGSYIAPWKEGNHLDVFWKVVTGCIRTYLDSGYDVVFNYIIGKEKMQELREAFSSYEVKFTVLITDEETLVRRDLMRDEDSRMGERCLVLLKEFLQAGYPEKYILDTSKLDIHKTAGMIINEDRFFLGHGKKKNIAACGNDCASCPRYTSHPFEKTEEELARTAQLWKDIGYRDSIEDTCEMACKGCSPENRCRYGIISCCAEKGLGSCAECPDYPCNRLLESFSVTFSFEPALRRACTDEEYETIKRAFFEKKKNLDILKQE